jgi:hypothetical protein
MKLPEKPKILFPKPKDCQPAFPITKVSKTVVIDSNGTAYDTYEVNGETMYKVKFEVVI